LEKTLYACDEMSGFVTAASLVRPSKSILDLEASSVVKRMKDKAFARAVSRDALRRGAEELSLPLDQHIANVIAFMRLRADELGLRGSLERQPESLAARPSHVEHAHPWPVSRLSCSDPRFPSNPRLAF